MTIRFPRGKRLLGLAVSVALLSSTALLSGSSVASGTTGAALGATGATTSDTETGAYAVFSYPKGSGDTIEPDLTIENHLISLVDHAPAGSVIRGAMYSWTREPVAEAMARAAARGVQVDLAIDGGIGGGTNADPTNTAIPILKNAGLHKLVLCSTTLGDGAGCVTDRKGSINHNKLFTFSQTGGKKNVAWIASHNFTNSQLEHFNNALVVFGDRGLYDFYQGYFERLLAQEKNNDFFNSGNAVYRSDASRLTTYESPRADSTGGTVAEASTDTIAQLLKSVQTYEKGCQVDVAHASFTGPRLPVATELIRIGQLGCQVRIVVGTGMSAYIRGQFADKQNITIRNLPNLHSKYILVHGNLDGVPQRTRVNTGSHNLTGPALRVHDETLVSVDQAQISVAYACNFARLWQVATP